VPRIVIVPLISFLAFGCGGSLDPVGNGPPDAGAEAEAEAGSESGTDTGADANEAGSAESSVEGGDASEVGPTECPAPVHVATAEQLEAAVQAVEWGMRELLPNGKNATGDLIFDADVELDSARVTVPDCSFRCSGLDLHLANGTCLEMSNDDAGTGARCTRFRVTSGASFRILKVSLLGGFFGATRPSLLTLPPCNAPCTTDQRSCARLHVCMPAVPSRVGGSPLDVEIRSAQGSYCSTCLGQTAAQCACFTFDGPKAEGTPCFYDTSDDTGESGTCHAGRCSRD
jgi:hypothetical protein